MSSNFKFNNLNDDLEIQIDANLQAVCPKCKSKFKQLLQHLKKNLDCRSLIENFENFRDEYQQFMNRRKQNSHRKRKLEADGDKLHIDVAKKVRQHRKSKLENNAEELHTFEATKKRNQREKNAEELHTFEAKKKR